MIIDADRALVRNIKAGKVLDGAWDAMQHREEAYALGRIEGARVMQEAAAGNIGPVWFPTDYNYREAVRSIRALDPETIAKDEP